jgi:hypothetical protein
MTDPQRRGELARLARSRIEQAYSTDVMVAEYVRLYERLLARAE